MVSMSTAISETDTAMDLCDRLEARLARVEAAMERRGTVRRLATGGGSSVAPGHEGRRPLRVVFAEVPRFDTVLGELRNRLTRRLARAERDLLRAFAGEMRLEEAGQAAA